MSGIEVAVMEPKYQQNLGYIARVSKNFGVKRLILINPRCNHIGSTAIKYSKHARELLERSAILKDIRGLAPGFIIGTTGIWHKTNASYYNVYSAGQISRLSRRAHSAGKRIILLLGRDDTGLSREELRQCDATAFIRASVDYPILNISHALAILLNSISDSGKGYGFMARIYADAKDERNLFRLFGMLVSGNRRIRDRRGVELAFRHMVKRSIPTKKEINALSVALSLGSKKNKK